MRSAEKYIPLSIFRRRGRPHLQSIADFSKGRLVFLFGLIKPFLTFFLGKFIEELLVNGATECGVARCRDIVLTHTFLKDRIDETAIGGSPEIVGSTQARFLDAGTRNFGHENSHRVRSAHFECRLLGLRFCELIMKPAFNLLQKKVINQCLNK